MEKLFSGLAEVQSSGSPLFSKFSAFQGIEVSCSPRTQLHSGNRTQCDRQSKNHSGNNINAREARTTILDGRTQRACVCDRCRGRKVKLGPHGESHHLPVVIYFEPPSQQLPVNMQIRRLPPPSIHLHDGAPMAMYGSRLHQRAFLNACPANAPETLQEASQVRPVSIAF